MQVKEVVISRTVMGMPSWDYTVNKINDIDHYKTSFETIYGEPLTAEQIQETIAEYERSLVLVNSPFDQYLHGDENAISEAAKQGYQLFKSYGCVSCHQGVNVGGNMFQKIGVLKDINLRDQADSDLGRHGITGNEWDKRVFKVPSLRLAVHTAPYFHDGSVKTLREAIDIMTDYQLGRTVPDEHKDAMIEFLKTLPGELPQEQK
jgi:cytochrome c peroxidase